MDISMDKAKALLDRGIAEAQELIKNPDGIDGLLVQLENKLKEVPAIGDTLSDLPAMIGMIKGYITREYSAVSPKVIAVLVGAVIYLVKKKDIIPDNIPVVGIADDLAVLGLALNLCKAELAAYKEFRDGAKPAEPALLEGPSETQPAEEPEAVQESGKYVCTVCGYVYDPAEHDGIAFADLPEGWKCPRCKQSKDKFDKA